MAGLFLYKLVLRIIQRNLNTERHILKYLKPGLTAIIIVVVLFVAASFLDILLVFFYPRFYSNAAFIVTFGVGGIFAGELGYMYGIIRFTICKRQPGLKMRISFRDQVSIFNPDFICASYCWYSFIPGFIPMLHLL